LDEWLNSQREFDQWIVEADKAFAFSMIAWVTWTVFAHSLTSLIFPLLICGGLMLIDGLSRGSRPRGIIHPIWHLGCAAFMYLFLSIYR